ncbi:hypothetical protein FPV67DRAFT_319621 [Lyophyllum atratum]|nr:hypothetical protein FPV67DRAFT_319621 [Lyophyllum atratum]
MSSSLLSIGSECSHPACNELDFLPIVCRCEKPFCRHHASPESHQCTFQYNLTHVPFRKLRRCDVSDCAEPALNTACLQCNKSFCPVHRHQTSHSCTVSDTPPSEKTMAARALLAKNFPASSSRKVVPQRVVKVPTDPVKLAQYRKIELMKMRHRAIPGDPKDGPSSAPLDQRLHVKVVIEGGSEKVFWFRKMTIAGKVLDFLTAHLKPKSSNESSLQLMKVLAGEDNHVLLNDRTLADQVEDGDTLLIANFDPKA